MEPLQKWDSSLTSGSSHVTTVDTSQEGSSSSHLLSLEQLRMGLSGLTTTPGSSASTALAEGLLQGPCVEQKNFLEQRWGQLGFPQKKKAFLGRLRRRHRDHRAPYAVERDSRLFRSGNRAQNWFRCECLYCQARGQNIIGERDGASNPSSWDTLVQGLGGLTLSLGAERPSLFPEGAQQQQQQQRQQCRQQQRQQQQQQQCQAAAGSSSGSSSVSSRGSSSGSSSSSSSVSSSSSSSGSSSVSSSSSSGSSSVGSRGSSQKRTASRNARGGSRGSSSTGWKKTEVLLFRGHRDPKGFTQCFIVSFCV
ncbi:hypothetical protein STEG23_013095 [Scotinomys teguina]